jgi:hypothetical protein
MEAKKKSRVKLGASYLLDDVIMYMYAINTNG